MSMVLNGPHKPMICRLERSIRSLYQITDMKENQRFAPERRSSWGKGNIIGQLRPWVQEQWKLIKESILKYQAWWRVFGVLLLWLGWGGRWQALKVSQEVNFWWSLLPFRWGWLFGLSSTVRIHGIEFRGCRRGRFFQLWIWSLGSHWSDIFPIGNNTLL